MQEQNVKSIINLENDEIDRIQDGINKHNLSVIKQAYDQCRITLDDYDYLHGFYQDGMGVYREVYRVLFETFKHPEYTCAIDLESGKVDTDAQGNQINYGLKAVTPFTCTRLEYVDKFKNPIYVIFPKMKSAERAIEKLEIEYGKEYKKELSKAAERFFALEDRDAFCEDLQNITKSSAKLHDILRLTITCKYFSDVERIKRVLTENRSGLTNYFINPNETRDRFTKPIDQNPKKYYDIKMIMHQRTPRGDYLDVEIQLKIHTLYLADLRTHKIYESIRAAESQLAQSAFPADTTENRHLNAQIKILTNRIRSINENAIHQYNMMVIDKARRIEDDGYRPLRVQPDFKDGTYQECRRIITNEYLAESYEPFNPAAAFSEDKEVNKLCFLRMANIIDPNFDEFAPDANKTINAAFANLSPAERKRFDAISQTALKYAAIIKHKIGLNLKKDNIVLTAKKKTAQR